MTQLQSLLDAPRFVIGEIVVIHGLQFTITHIDPDNLTLQYRAVDNMVDVSALVNRLAELHRKQQQ